MALHDTHTLLGLISGLTAPSKALSNVYLTQQVNSDTEYVDFDKLGFARPIAAYSSPYVPGRVGKQRSEKIMSFAPAYLKPKDMVDPARVIKRRSGERIGGELSPAQRFDLVVADLLREQDEKITRREEAMAIEALRTGKVVVSGEDVAATEIDYGRDSGQTVTLSGGARWGQSGVKALDSLKTWAETVQKASGAHPYHVVMDPKAAALFTADADVRAILNVWRQASGILELAGVAVGGQGREYRLLGKIGDFEVYVYQQYYHLEGGTPAQMMPDNTVIMGNPELASGVQAYGAIRDRMALAALPRFPKMWDEQDPAITFLMTQSAPLPVFGRIEATLAATVNS